MFSSPYSPYHQQGYGPMGQPYGNAQQPVHGFVYVQGIEAARAYPLPNGSEMPLFDNDRNILYMKTVDQAGRMSIQVMDCVPHVEQQDERGEYATQADIRAIYSEIEDLRSAIGSTGTQPAHAKE